VSPSRPVSPPAAPAATNANPHPAQAVRHLRRDVVAMSGYTPGEQARDCVKLNTNECAWDPSPRVLAALGGIGAGQLRLYPDPLSRRLRETAAATYGVSPAHVLAGNGSDDCLTIIYRAFLSSGERVASPWPTYGLYDTLATLQGVEMVHVDYRQSADTWKLPSKLAKQAAKVVIVANPNNPSATLTPVAELRQLAYELDGILVVDEAYVDFAGAAASMLPYLDQHPNLIVLRTFSKSYSLAGARLGLLFAQPALVEHLEKVKDSYNVNAITQALGTAALEDRDHHRELVRQTLAERARLEGGLKALGWSWPESAGNFLLCEVGARAGAIYRGLKEQGILVRWWDRPGLDTRLRITVGRPEQTDALLRHLRTLA
jgi:histidinol-phosphate aminotransferase